MRRPIPRCVCGLPLHYRSSFARAAIDALVLHAGPDMPVTDLSTGRTWRVPRHYIALHGLAAPELPMIADRYGFPEVTTTCS